MLSSRCSSWSQSHLFPQLLPYSINVSSPIYLISDYILKLYSFFIPIIGALHRLYSLSCDSPMLCTLWPRFQIHVSRMCLPAPLRLPLPAPHPRLWDIVQRVGLCIRWPLGSNPGSAQTCCVAWPVFTLSHPLCSPLCQVPWVGEHARLLQASLCPYCPPPDLGPHTMLALGAFESSQSWGLLKVRDSAFQLSHQCPIYFTQQAAEAQSSQLAVSQSHPFYL